MHNSKQPYIHPNYFTMTQNEYNSSCVSFYPSTCDSVSLLKYGRWNAKEKEKGEETRKKRNRFRENMVHNVGIVRGSCVGVTKRTEIHAQEWESRLSRVGWRSVRCFMGVLFSVCLYIYRNHWVGVQNNRKDGHFIFHSERLNFRNLPITNALWLGVTWQETGSCENRLYSNLKMIKPAHFYRHQRPLQNYILLWSIIKVSATVFKKHCRNLQWGNRTTVWYIATSGLCSQDKRFNERLQVKCITIYLYSNACDLFSGSLLS